jgi:hypothetical protein
VDAQLDALLAANIQGYEASRLWTAADGPEYGASPAVTFSCYSIPGVESSPGVPLNNYRVTIYVAYQNPVFFPLLSYATDFLDRSPNGTWDLTAEASMRIESCPVGSGGVSAMRRLGGGMAGSADRVHLGADPVLLLFSDQLGALFAGQNESSPFEAARAVTWRVNDASVNDPSIYGVVCAAVHDELVSELAGGWLPGFDETRLHRPSAITGGQPRRCRR